MKEIEEMNIIVDSVRIQRRKSIGKRVIKTTNYNKS